MHCCLLAVNIEAHCDLALYQKRAPLAVAGFAQSNSTQHLGCQVYLLLAAVCADFNNSTCTAAAHPAQCNVTCCIKCQKHSNCACYNNNLQIRSSNSSPKQCDSTCDPGCDGECGRGCECDTVCVGDVRSMYEASCDRGCIWGRSISGCPGAGCRCPGAEC